MRCRNLGSVLAAVPIACAIAIVGVRADGPTYTVLPGWGEVPGNGVWGDVLGVAIDREGNIVAFRRAEPPILKFNPAGKLLASFGDGMFAAAHGLRIDRDGFIWAADFRAVDGKGQQVVKMTPDGRVVMTLGTKGTPGDSATAFNGPCDMAFAPDGDIFVADGHVNARVVKFSRDGKFIKAWGTKGNGPGQFNVPHAIVLDSRGRVLVADRNNNRIQIFDQDGTYLDEWKQFGQPSGLFIAPDDTLYVADVAVKKGIVVGSARDGSVTGLIQGTLPEGIAVSEDGTLYAGETTMGHSLKKLVKH
jgi:DNA-binding beta-propeller fold protein YncE